MAARRRRNVLRERYRDEVRQASLAVELRAWTGDAAADVADGVTERVALLAALATLRDDDRELLTLIAWHGLTPRQPRGSWTARWPPISSGCTGREDGCGRWWVTEAVNGFRDLPEGSYLKFGPLTAGRRFPLGPVDPLTRVDVTTAELATAPTDPARLTDRIRRAGAEPAGEILFRSGESLVMHLPVTPPLRAAATLQRYTVMLSSYYTDRPPEPPR